MVDAQRQPLRNHKFLRGFHVFAPDATPHKTPQNPPVLYARGRVVGAFCRGAVGRHSMQFGVTGSSAVGSRAHRLGAERVVTVREPSNAGKVASPTISSPLTLNSPPEPSPKRLTTVKWKTSPPTLPASAPEPRPWAPPATSNSIVPLTFGPSCSRWRVIFGPPPPARVPPETVPCQTPVTSTVTSVDSIQSGRVTQPLLNSKAATMRVAPAVCTSFYLPRRLFHTLADWAAAQPRLKLGPLDLMASSKVTPARGTL